MYRIGLFSKITHTTVKTLRYYDEIGLLKPAYIDQVNNYRYYTTPQLLHFHKIISLRQCGLSIEEVSDIIKGNDIEKVLLKRMHEISSQITLYGDQLSKITNFINEKEEEFNMNYKAIIKELPECIVFSKDTTIKDYSAYFTLIPSIEKTVRKANPNIKHTNPDYCFVMYHDGEYKEKDIHIEYCQAVEEMGNDVEDITFKNLEAVKAISVMHKGAYQDLGNAYSYIFTWIEKNGYKVIGSPRESYISGIWNTKDENEWITEIQVPIK